MTNAPIGRSQVLADCAPVPRPGQASPSPPPACPCPAGLASLPSVRSGARAITQPFTIRPARAGDAEDVFQVTRASVEGLARSHYSAAQIAGWMGDRTPETYRADCAAGRIKVAERADRLVGYVDAVPGELTRLFLLPEVAGQGVGKALFAVGLRQARQGHAGPVRLEATLNAAPFYASRGFRPVGEGTFGGRGPGYPAIPVVIMEEATAP